MITPSFNITATERVLPKLALDFTVASLDSRITFARVGNTATVTNSLGYIAAINANLPRFDYSPVTLVCNGLLIEETRTNLFLQSNNFTNSYWRTSNVTLSSVSDVNPEGVSSTVQFIPSSGISVKNFDITAVQTFSATAYTHSYYVKSTGWQFVQLLWTTSLSTNYANFDVINGTVTTNSGGTSSITNAGNGWWRITLSSTLAATSARTVFYFINDGTSARASTATGDGILGVDIYGAQLEAGAFATSYIPTTTTVLTRNADVATMTGTNFSDWFNASEGAFAASGYFKDASAVGTAGLPLFTATDGVSVSSNIFELRRQNNSGNPYIRMMTYSGGNVETSSSLGFTTGQPVSAAMGYIVNNVSGAINGNTNVTDTVAVMPVGIDRLQLGSSFNQYMNGWLQSLRFWPQRLTNNEIRAFSK